MSSLHQTQACGLVRTHRKTTHVPRNPSTRPQPPPAHIQGSIGHWLPSRQCMQLVGRWQAVWHESSHQPTGHTPLSSSSQPDPVPNPSVEELALPDRYHGLCDATSALLAEWKAVTVQLAAVVAERHTHNRKGRISALRSELQRIQSCLPADIANELENELIQSRAQAARQREQRVQTALQTGPKVVVDCGFAAEHCRPGLERRSLAKQVEWAMAVNRRSDAPVSLHVTGWTGEVAAFGQYIGSSAWPVAFHEAGLLDVFPKEKIVVLSPDAAAPLTQLDPEDVYVVGGIVDRTVKKGVTADYAAQHGLRSARLPIAEHASTLGMDVPGVRVHPVLNVSDVVIALIEAHRTQGDWEAALRRAVPERKRRQQVDNKRRRQRAQSLTVAVSEN